MKMEGISAILLTLLCAATAVTAGYSNSGEINLRTEQLTVTMDSQLPRPLTFLYRPSPKGAVVNFTAPSRPAPPPVPSPPPAPPSLPSSVACIDLVAIDGNTTQF